MSDVRTILERGIGGATPPPDGFERMLRRRDRKRRNQRIAAGVVGIAVFAVAIWIVMSGEPVDRGLTPDATGSSAAPDSPEPVGVVGLPPQDAPPSLPARGELVLSFMFGHTGGDPGRFGLHVYEDGRAIWQRLTASEGGLVEQRLTPEGVELIRSEVLATGLFDQDAVRLVNAYGLFYGQIEVRDGDRLLSVAWGDGGPNDVPEEPATAAQVSAIERLDTRLEDLASWLPASAWVDPEPRPFVASRYAICYEAEGPVDRDTVLASLPQPAEDLLRTWERTHDEVASLPLGTPLESWCSFATTQEARDLSRILDGAGAGGVARDVYGLRYRFGQRTFNVADVTLTFEPALPDAP